MKVEHGKNNKTYICERVEGEENRWWLEVRPGYGPGAASQEELEWIASKIVQALDGKSFDSWGCYCNEQIGEGPDDMCVIDEDRREDCTLAINWPNRKRVERKEDCKYWRRIE